jgi:hypothetical protein
MGKGLNEGEAAGWLGSEEGDGSGSEDWELHFWGGLFILLVVMTGRGLVGVDEMKVRVKMVSFSVDMEG